MKMKDIGNYKIVKEIGEGGFGTIYKAEHNILKGRYATIKVNKEKTKDAADLLKLEATLLWDMDHPFIPHPKEFRQIGTNQYAMIMKYVKGDTIEELVKKNSRLHQEDTCWVTERILGALHYCHRRGVVHGDVKPQNIFMNPKDAMISLIDFGLSVYKPGAGTMPIGYSEAYAAPEIIEGKTPIPESDIYGAGIVMLYMLGGDVIGKKLPKDIAKPINDFCNSLIRYDPLDRPNWEKDNPITKLMDVRYKVFGRKHRSA